MAQQLIGRRALIGAAGASLTAIALLGPGHAAGSDRQFPLRRSKAEWRRLLEPQRYSILREGATERAYSSPLNKEHRRGLFACAGCGRPLFSSAAKYDSGTGWPSFTRPLPGAVATRADHSLMMKRTEVLCSRCGGHLGHVFPDGPRPTGLRYCMNGLALRFRPA